MIIDCHAHLVAPDSLYSYRTMLQAGAGHLDLSWPLDEAGLAACAANNVAIMDAMGTDVQLLSPRPFQQMHSAKPPSIVHNWIATNNDAIAHTVSLHPDRFMGVAGLPLCGGEPVESVFEELDRAVETLGFVGVSLNPDPWEGKGFTPLLGDEFWYPLYQRLVDLDVPILVHSAGCENGRESYADHFLSEESIATLSLARSSTFDDFPTLKVIIPHGAGSVPYQIGRWEAERRLPGLGGSPDLPPLRDSLRRMWFDTVLHRRASLELLIDTVGADRLVFGTERPGSGSSEDPLTGRPFDDVKSNLEEISQLDDEQRRAIFETNPLAVFPRAAMRLA
ncbi:amidohydrolase family protein [Nocardioides sp.]|uniref:amidohydrolase family protein n=1 Tax=Nocardioides sp. TaxID=35761 RepID=UPI003D0CEA10